MTESHKRRLDLFVKNTWEIKSGFIWQSPMMKHMAALLYAAEDREINVEAIRQSYDMMKGNTGLFSMFRGNSALSIAAMLSLVPDMEKRLLDTLKVYDLLKEARFYASDYLAVAAYQIAAGTDADGYSNIVWRMRSFYDDMKAQHPFLTSRDDYIFSAMLGLSDVDIAAGMARMEQLYQALKPEFLSGNGVQALAQVLILGNQTCDAIDRVLALRQSFRDFKLRLDHQYTVSSLGVLTLLPGTVFDIVRGVRETFDFLRAQKGFSTWSFQKQELSLFAAALVAYDNMASLQSGLLTTALSTSFTNIIIAQQATMAAVAASSAAASAAN